MVDLYERERYVLVLRLPREVEVRIEDTYLLLGGASKPTLGYHITLLGPLYFSADWEALRSRVRDVCEVFPSFTVEIDGIAVFPSPDNHVIYLPLVNAEPVVSLHAVLLQTLQSDVTWPDERYLDWMVQRYNPHVTLGLGLRDGELDDFMRVARARSFRASFAATRVCMATQKPYGNWQYIADFPLREQPLEGLPVNPPCSR